MRKTTLFLSLAAALLAPAVAAAQATVELRLGLPVVLPQLVVVSPGVQVVPDMEEEVFFTDGYYWVRHDHAWYRSHDHRGGWVLVPGRAVPGRIAGIPPGRYRHWRPAPAAYRGGPAYRGGGPVYRGGGPVYRGGGPVYRGGPPEHRGGGPVYRGGGPEHRGGDHEYRGGGHERRGGGDDGGRRGKGGRHGGDD